MTPSLVIKPERSCGYILCCSSGNVILSEEHNKTQGSSTSCFESFMNTFCCGSSNPSAEQNSRIRSLYESQLQKEFGPVVSQIALSQINWTDPHSSQPDHIQREAVEIKEMLPILEKAFKHYKVYKMISEGPHPCSPLAQKTQAFDHVTTLPSSPVFILKNNKKEVFEKEKIIHNLQTIALHASLERLGEIAEDVESYVRDSKRVVTSDDILRLVVKEILSKNIAIDEPPVQFPREFSSYSRIEEIPPDSLSALFKDKAFSQLRSTKECH